MPRKIEATVSPELYNALKAECKKRAKRLHRVAGELLAERLTLEAAPAVAPETPSMSEAPRPRRRSRSSSGSSAPKSASPDTAPDLDN